MSLEINLVNLGEYPNDGTGDDLRTAFEKLNGNLTSIENNVVLSAVNVGQGAPLFLDKQGNNLRFRSIKSQDEKLSIGFDSNEITFDIADFLESIEEDTTPKLGGNLDLNSFEINGIGDIDITGVIIADGFEGNFLGNLYGDVFGSVFGNLVGNVDGQVSDISNHSLSSLANVSSQTPQEGEALVWDGTFWKPSPVSVTSTALDDLTDVEINSPVTGQVIKYDGSKWVNGNSDIAPIGYDFGLLSGVTSPFELLFQFTPIDFGSFTNPSSVTLDLGLLAPAEEPTYQLSASSLIITEGNVLTFTLTTTNVANGTLVPYEITGVTSEDINGTSLIGSFVVLNNSATLTLPITTDLQTEDEQLTLTLSGISPTVSITVTIENAEIPAVFDGGDPSSTEFEFSVDGGSPIVIFNDFILDGGIVIEIGLIPPVVDGGSPGSPVTVILDGEAPGVAVTVLVDGGLV